MADYDKRYRLDRAPTARTDGSGCVDHDIWAEASEEGEDDWFTIPGRHQTICIPADEVQTALAAGTNQQIIAAYKDALVDNMDTMPQAIRGWSDTALEALLDANDAATAAATAVSEFVTVTLGQAFPITFTL